MKKTNKLISILLAVLMLLSMVPLSLTASAASPTPYDGVPVTPQKISSNNYKSLGLTDANWSQFNGYYAIRNAKELYGFASIVNGQYNTAGFNAVLLQDIVVNANGGSTYDWTPLNDRSSSNYYEGIFDGNGHFISGLYSTVVLTAPGGNNKYGGFVFKLRGTVKNLIIKDSTFAPGVDIGATGGLGVITGYPSKCTIQNCRIENVTIKSINDAGQLGGIAGYGGGNNSTIKNCVSINVTFSGGKYTEPIAPVATYSNCYTSATASHNCTDLSVEHKEVKATCEYPGLSNYKYCLVCGKVTSGTKTETPATGHTWKSATCKSPKTCSSCGLTEGSTVSHKYTTYNLSANATCGVNAKETAFCDYGCGTTDTREISGTALRHVFNYTAEGDTITATCTVEGCTLENSDGGYITIHAPVSPYVDGITAKEAEIEDRLVENVDYNITYSTPDGKAPTATGSFTASVTVGGATASVDFELIKKSAVADNFIFTAPYDCFYDGRVKYATVEVSPEITDMGEITVKYYHPESEADEPVVPIEAGTYIVTVSIAETDRYYAINNIVLGSFDIEKKVVDVNASDASKIYGEEDPESFAYSYNLSYSQYKLNGEPSRTPGENVGVYEIGQGTITNENNPNFYIIFDSGLFTIEPDVSGIEGITPLNVKSSDKAKIEYVYNQLENAVTDLADADKRAEWDNLKSDCVEMLALISDTADEISRIVNAVNAYDVNTVTGDDVKDLLGLIDDVNALLETDNLTPEETEVLNQAVKDVQRLISIYDTVSAQLGDIKERMNSYDEATVKSSDKADIEQLIADIKELTDGQNLTAAEREYLVNADAECDKFLAKIAETKSEYDRVIAAANGYDKATVTSADRDALDKLRIDAHMLSDTDNVTPEEKENLLNAFEKLTEMVETLINVGNEIERIISAVGGYDEATVKYSDYKDILQLIDDIEALTEGQNITEDERANLEELKTKANLLAAKIRSTADEIARITRAVNAYNIDTVKSSDKAAIENLIARIKKLTDGDNITADERNQLEGNEATLNALLDKINATADEIARIEEAVNSYDEATVKSTDKADLEQLVEDIKALTDATNITEEERTALEALDATADELIKKIDDTAAEIERIDEAVNSYDKETVTSDDIPALGKLIEDINAITDGDNITEDEKAALEANDEAIDELIEELAEVAEEIKRVDEAVKSYDEDTVKSSDSEELAQLKEDVQALIDSTNTTENEKTALEEKIKDIEGLEGKIEEIEQQLEEISDIESSYNPETVTSDDKATIEETIAEIDAVNPDNLTDEQKAEYEEIKAEFEALLEEIAAAGAEVDAIGGELEMFDEKRVTIFWEDDIEALKAKIDELIADENMGEAEKAKLNEYKAECDNLIEIINNPWKYFSLRLFYLIWDCLLWKYNGIVNFLTPVFG